MKAVVYKGPHQVAVDDIEEPRIESPTDAIVRITTSGLCGSDLHMYEGRTVAQPGIVFGHEPMGVVEEVGNGVVAIRRGDRVVMPFNVACGFCFNCARGYTSACLTVNPDTAGGAYGYVNMGPYRGGQAEFLRVPFADANCLKLPGEPGDQQEDDFILLADVFPTGYHGAVLAGVEPGSTAAVFGAGPVGLMAAYSSILRGASQVFVVDYIPERLQKAESIGAIPINFTQGDPVEQIFEIRRSNPGIMGGMRPGEEKMMGVMCGIEAVGYEAKHWEDPSRENPTQVLDGLVRVLNPTGSLAIIGVYLSSDPGGVDQHAQQGEYVLPLGRLWEKGIAVGTGQVPVGRYNRFLRDLIIAGRANPGFVVSHHVPLNQAQDAYEKFDQRIDGYTKVVLKP